MENITYRAEVTGHRDLEVGTPHTLPSTFGQHRLTEWTIPGIPKKSALLKNSALPI